MRVDIGRIRDRAGASVSARGTVAPPSNPGFGFTALTPVEVEATVTNTGRFLHAEGRIRLRLLADCVRCLSSFSLELDIPFNADYRHGANAAPQDGEDEFPAVTGDLLSLDEPVNEAVVLALPMKPLCREDCRGLCPRCGADLNHGVCTCGGGGGAQGWG
ncbi:MAG: YceD family protein [Patescibacteria group bacterium]